MKALFVTNILVDLFRGYSVASEEIRKYDYATAKAENRLLVTRNTNDFDPTYPDIRCPYTI